MIEKLKSEILKVNSANFDALALKIFHFQAKNCPVYHDYLHYLKFDIAQVDEISKIPFLPINFFKTNKVLSNKNEIETVFESSGTTGLNTSRHYVTDTEFYKRNSLAIFENQYGSIENYHIIALLPSYLERGNSSLVYMIKHFIECSKSSFSGFYLHDYEAIMTVLIEISRVDLSSKKILLWGVTFALLDFLEKGYDFSEFEDKLIILETGGMKGRKKEMVREALYDILKKGFGVKEIHSEYGMTELLSQAYSQNDATFQCPNTLKIVLREVNDPFTIFPQTTLAKTGGINVIDLANVDSCSFIETQDLGQYYNHSGAFKVLGRFDNADLRGCNLLVN